MKFGVDDLKCGISKLFESFVLKYQQNMQKCYNFSISSTKNRFTMFIYLYAEDANDIVIPVKTTIRISKYNIKWHDNVTLYCFYVHLTFN